MNASDPCLFVRLMPEQGIRTYVWIHVDDTIIASTHEAELEYLKQNLQTKITLHDFTKHRGINIDHLESGVMKLRQKKLLGALFNEYPLTGRKANQPQ